MDLILRLKNLWKLSEYQAGAPQDEYKQPGTQIVTLVKKPPQNTEKATFIPRIRISPAERIINESTES